MTAPDDPAGGWKVGDRVRFTPRFGFDAHLHHGTIVEVQVRPESGSDNTGAGPDDIGGRTRPTARFTVQVDPADGSGRIQLELAHLVRP